MVDDFAKAGTFIANAATRGLMTKGDKPPLKTPTDCFGVLIPMLDAHPETAALASDVKHQWMCDELDVDAAIVVMKYVAMKASLPDVKDLAVALMKELETAKAQGGYPLARLHDNEVARQWETRWALAGLEEKPTEAFVTTAEVFGKHWSGLFGQIRDAYFAMEPDMTSAKADQVMNSMELEHFPPSWIDRHEGLKALEALQGKPGFATKVKEILETPPVTAYDCLAIYFLGKSIDSMGDGDPLADASIKKLYDDMLSAKGRFVDPGKNEPKFAESIKREDTAIGITATHHRHVAQGRSGKRPVQSHVPDFGRLTPEGAAPLHAGRPKIAGPSGHALYPLFKADLLREQATRSDMSEPGVTLVDTSQALLAYGWMMILNGAHSWQEILKPTHQVTGRLSATVLKPMGDAGSGKVPSYEDLIELFKDTPTADLLRKTADQAWRV